MLSTPISKIPVVGVGVVVWNDQNEVALIRREKPPRFGEWSIPGGHLEWGESLRDAATREVLEETGLAIAITGLIDVVDSLNCDENGVIIQHYVLVDFAARWVSGNIRAGEDALEARWTPYSAIDDLSLWAETARIIKSSAARSNSD